MTTGMAPRLLVVEDEPLVRMFAVDALIDLGFDVDEVGTAAEACAKIGEGVRYAAALADMRLPDRNDMNWALELRSGDPELPLLIFSGLDERSVRDVYAHVRHVDFLQKPYTQNALSDVLKRLGIVPPVEASL